MADEVLLTVDGEILFRQINPAFLVEGEFTSQIFEVTPKDQGELSIDQQRLSSAKEAHERFVGQGYASAGVTHVTVGECSALELNSYHKPETLNPAHGFIDFRETPSKQARKKKARKLKLAAQRHGLDYEPDTGG